jgi:hypothetical protein
VLIVIEGAVKEGREQRVQLSDGLGLQALQRIDFSLL